MRYVKQGKSTPDENTASVHLQLLPQTALRFAGR